MRPLDCIQPGDTCTDLGRQPLHSSPRTRRLHEHAVSAGAEPPARGRETVTASDDRGSAFFSPACCRHLTLGATGLTELPFLPYFQDPAQLQESQGGPLSGVSVQGCLWRGDTIPYGGHGCRLPISPQSHPGMSSCGLDPRWLSPLGACRRGLKPHPGCSSGAGRGHRFFFFSRMKDGPINGETLLK